MLNKTFKQLNAERAARRARPKKKTKHKAGTAKPKKKFEEDKKTKQTKGTKKKGTERKETGTRQKRIEKPVYKKKVTPPAKNYGKGKK